ncbi:MAG: HEAT repeat domain-containing protein [Candidatus Marinimicrobia bacterium]|nr:HEAT repeat domain-containing protein [Candidatus Neomarinimicrobiota bacterium]
MTDILNTFISRFMHDSNDKVVLTLLLAMILFFFTVTVILFFVTVYLRVYNNFKEGRDRALHAHWDPVILGVADESIHILDGFRHLRKKYSMTYLLYLEQYIDLLKGKERDRLITLGKLSLKNVYRDLRCRKQKKIMHALHMIGLFRPEEQMANYTFDPRNVEMSLITIREMRTIDNIRIKEQLVHMIFMFNYVSPMYIKNILVDMGEDIVPLLRQIIRERYDSPSQQIIALETINSLHLADLLELSGDVLNKSRHPGVIAACLRFIENVGGASQKERVLPLLSDRNPAVRQAAVRAYISVTDKITRKEIAAFFNDEHVMIPVSAARKLQEVSALPYISLEEIDSFRWADIYKRMVY